MPKKKRSYTLTDEADRLLEHLALRLGVSKTAILELSIREKALREGVEVRSQQAASRADIDSTRSEG